MVERIWFVIVCSIEARVSAANNSNARFATAGVREGEGLCRQESVVT